MLIGSLSQAFRAPFLAGGNAVLTRELRVALRSVRAFGLMAFYVAVLGAVVSVQFPADRSLAVIGVGAGGGTEGRALFQSFFWVQAMMVVLLLPALAVGSLGQERESATLEPLLLSPLLPGQIVWGKAVGVLLFAALLLVSALPVTSLCFLLNGVSPGDLMASYAVLLGLAAFVTGFGLYCGAHWTNTTGAIFACYGYLPIALGTLLIFVGPGTLVSGAYLVGGFFYALSICHRRLKEKPWASRLGAAYDIGFGLVALVGLYQALQLLTAHMGIGSVSFLLLCLAAYCFFVARIGLEMTGEEIAKRPEPRRPRAQRVADLKREWQRAVSPAPVLYLPPPTGRFPGTPYVPPAAAEVAAQRKETATYGRTPFLSLRYNAVFQKEMRAGALGRFVYLVRFCYGVVIASELWLLFSIVSLAGNSVNDNSFSTIFVVFGSFHLALVMTMGAVFGARALANERESQTLDQLLTTPLRGHEIVGGKYMAVLLYCFYVLMLAAPLAMLTGALGLVPIKSALWFIALEMVWAAFCAAWGLFCSLRGVTVRRALGRSLGLVLGLFIANMLAHNELLSPTQLASSLRAHDLTIGERTVLFFDRYLGPFTTLSNAFPQNSRYNTQGSTWVYNSAGGPVTLPSSAYPGLKAQAQRLAAAHTQQAWHLAVPSALLTCALIALCSLLILRHTVIGFNRLRRNL